jgi:photosystem II stability/assembly factor-like uncharacterized protein
MSVRHLRVLSGLLLVVTARLAYADGAFPGQTQVLFPEGAPERILVGTNFGLLLSDDNGAHWYFVCESVAVPNGGNVSLYQLGQNDTVFALAPHGFGRSDDGGLTWKAGSGAIAGLTLLDAFADPNDDSFVLVIAAASDGSTALYPSRNGGQTFDAPILKGGAATVQSVEISRTQPGVIYVTTSTVDTTVQPSIWRSTDRGATWSTSTPANLSGLNIAIAQVDPTDANTLYLRMTDSSTSLDSLGISTDGGASVETAVVLDETMGGFARLEDGTLFVGGPPTGTTGSLWSRAPGATSWTQTMTSVIPCLGARGNTLYACGTGIGSDFGLGSSTDAGATFDPLLFLSDVIGPAPCDPVRTACSSTWASLLGSFTFIGTTPSSGGPYITCPAPQKKGCSCSDAPESALLLSLVAFWGNRRRHR